MRIFLSGILLCALSAITTAQIITTDPAVPVASESVTITYDATLGNQGLKDFTGEVYAHTGVLTSESGGNSDWRYVIAEWTENIDAAKMTRIGDNLYTLEISPSIRDFYDVPESETITHMAFVFRSADGSAEGKGEGNADIFVEVFEPGLSITIVNPDNNLLVDPGTTVPFKAATSETANVSLYLNNELIKSSTTNNLNHNFVFSTPGDFWIKATVTLADESDTDSVFVHVLNSQVNEALPAGLLNGINYIDHETVSLVLHAPGKEHVFVIGEWNDWTPRTDARMNLDGEHWWITISDLEPGREYGYQYLVDGTLRIADPYTEKVLDPWNDQWIDESTYPELKSYPLAYTSGIASILQPGKEAYSWDHTGFTPPARDQLVIYELLVRDFLEAHDWQTLTDTLHYFTELGVNAIELMPSNEFEGNESWGYNPSFYFAPDKYYGPADDLKAFVDSCHGRGIAVILDMTLNHSYGQSPLVQLYLDESTYKVTAENPWYNVTSPNQTYSWGYDFNHESPSTQAFVDRVNRHWLTEYNMDGFRFDFTKGFTNTPGDGWNYDAARINILKRMADEIWTVNEDAYVILEHLADNSEESVLANYGMMLWGNLNHNYGEAAMGFHDNNKSDLSWISYKERGWNEPNLVGYMESHDEERMMYRNLNYGNAAGSYDITNIFTALDRIKLAATFFFTVPGPKMLWQFGELGYDFSIDYNGRVGNKPIRWDYYKDPSRKKVFDIFAALIHLKKNEPAFSTTDFNMSVSGPMKRIELNHADMDVRILGNFDLTRQSLDPNFSKTGDWYNFFAGDTLEVTNPNDAISLAPGEYRIYTTKKLEKPRITAVEEARKNQQRSLLVYPVPATHALYIQSEQLPESYTVYDTGGRIVKVRNADSRETVMDISGYNPGIYFLKIRFSDGSLSHRKFMVE